jgi:hypothetical protein
VGNTPVEVMQGTESGSMWWNAKKAADEPKEPFPTLEHLVAPTHQFSLKR